LLTPEDALRQLEVRIIRLEAELARVDAELAGAARILPRLFLIEEEYLRAMLHTELEWVRSVADDLRAGRLSWDGEWLRAVASSLATGGAPREEGST
jgi:hypothetical protein